MPQLSGKAACALNPRYDQARSTRSQWKLTESCTSRAAPLDSLRSGHFASFSSDTEAPAISI